MRLNVGCATCAGNTQELNQDAAALRSSEKSGEYFAVLAVCDGIGGLEHGEIASSLTAKKIEAWYDGVLKWLDIKTADPELLYAHLKDLAEECNSVVREYQICHRINTGTTLSLLLIIKGFYYIVQVGDSRVYLYREGQLLQITRDASVTRMKNGREKVYLDNYLGKQETLWFTCSEGILQKGDILMVCSDGLYHHLIQKDLLDIEKDVRKAKKINAACEQLINRMLERGERDNITVGVVAVE